MANIIVVFPKPEDALSVGRLLRRSGHAVRGCTGPTGALQLVDELGEGIILSTYRIRGMQYDQLLDILPPTFHMLLLASQAVLAEGVDPRVESLSLPLSSQDLIQKVDEMCVELERERRLRRTGKKRSAHQTETINQAKSLLMEKNKMTEDEAHKYLQKASMDSGRSLTETAGMIVSLLSE